jgi:hypothetical protein
MRKRDLVGRTITGIMQRQFYNHKHKEMNVDFHGLELDNGSRFVCWVVETEDGGHAIEATLHKHQAARSRK